MLRQENFHKNCQKYKNIVFKIGIEHKTRLKDFYDNLILHFSFYLIFLVFYLLNK